MPTTEIKNLKALGAIVRHVRTSTRVSQADLADELNISRRYLWEIERGSQNLFITRLFRTLRKLNIRVHISYDNPDELSE
jgi:transcriptional regulator with XRE-family HTH domain